MPLLCIFCESTLKTPCKASALLRLLAQPSCNLRSKFLTINIQAWCNCKSWRSYLSKRQEKFNFYGNFFRIINSSEELNYWHVMAIVLLLENTSLSFFVCSESAVNDSIFRASTPARGGGSSSSGINRTGQHLLCWLPTLSLLTFPICWRSLTIIFSVSSSTVVNKLNSRAIQARPKRIQMATSTR